MLKTEEEARKLWCSFARGETHGINRWPAVGNVPANTCCIASQCMAWEFIEPGEYDVDTGKQTSPARGDCRRMRPFHESPAP